MQIFFKWFKSAIKILLLLAVIWFVGKALYNSILQVNWSLLRIKPFYIIWGSLIMLATNFLGALIQRTFFQEFNVTLSCMQGFSLFALPQLGKYLPGKLWTVIGYSGLAKYFQIPVTISGPAVFVLTGWAVAGGFLLGIVLALFNPAILGGQVLLNNGLLFVMVIFSLIFLHPRVFLRIINVALIFFKQPPISLDFSWRAMMEIVGGYFIFNFFYFLGLTVIVFSIVELPVSVLPVLVGIFCLANIAGFLALFAPAGIGVREGILLLVLGPLVGAGMAGLIAILSRLIQTGADIFSAALGLVTFYCAKKNSTAE